ncbi:MAG: DUF4340 domain-containing protein [Planctomycetota bacterium]|jgi:hypothetical protein
MANFRTSVVLGILVVVLTVVAVISESMSHKISERGNRKFFEFKKELVVEVKVEFPGAGRPTILAKKERDTWVLLEPLRAEAERQTVERVISYVVAAEGTARWSESDPDVKNFATDKIVVTLKLADGSEHWIKLGDLAGSEFRGFAKVSAEGGIWEISKGVYSPWKDLAEETDIYEFVSEIEKAQALDFVVEKATEADRKKYGFSPPAAVVAMGGKGRKSVISIGKVVKMGSGEVEWYAMRSDRPFIATVDPRVVSRVEVDSEYLFRGRLLVPEPSRWAPIEISVDGTLGSRAVKFRVKREQFMRWALQEPRKIYLDPAQEGYWGKFLNRVVNLRAEEFLSEDPTEDELAEKWGLGKGGVKMEITFQKLVPRGNPQGQPGALPERKVKVHLGKLDLQRGIVAARVEGRKNVVGVRHELVAQDLAEDYVRFLIRALNPIDEEAVLWIEFTHEGKKARWERRGVRWLLTDPKGGAPAVESLMKAALGQDLQKAQKYLMEIDDPTLIPEELRLHPPVSKLRVCQKTRGPIPELIWELHFGANQTGTSMYARYRKGDFHTGELVFLLGNSSYNVLLSLWRTAFPPVKKKTNGSGDRKNR